MREPPDKHVATLLAGLENENGQPWFGDDVYPSLSPEPPAETHPQAVYAESGREYREAYGGFALEAVEFLVTVTALDSEQCRTAYEALEKVLARDSRVNALSGAGESFDGDPIEYSRAFSVLIAA